MWYAIKCRLFICLARCNSLLLWALRTIRAPPPEFEFQKSNSGGIKIKEQGKWYITVENERIEVTEDVYRTYWHYTEKEKYFMGKLKKGKFVSGQEKEVAKFIPSREDSLERLEERGIKFPDKVSLTPEDTLYKKELYSFLKTALSALTDEEFNLIQELFYLEKNRARGRGTLAYSSKHHKLPQT